MVGEPQGDEIKELLKKASESHGTAERPYVAAASMEGIFVNQHLGEATELWIFGIRDGKAELLERRFAPSPGSGEERWKEMADLLHDCSAVLVSGVGEYPQIALERADIRVVVMEGMASEGVEAILKGKEIPKIMLRMPGRCGMGKECTGTGMGCG
jgi:nitrogen fixation protein NifB